MTYTYFPSAYVSSWSPKKAIIKYKQLIQQLQKAKLDFGIRMYIPELMHKITPIPPSSYAKAVFTEGHFRKETREQILKYWKDKSMGIEKKPANPVKNS